MKKIMVVFDPLNLEGHKTFVVEEGVIQLVQHLNRLGNKPLVCGEMKKEVIEILINNIRPEILELATYMETNLRLHDKKKKDSGKNMTTEECLERASQELREFEIVVKDKMTANIAFSEAANSMNFIMFAAINYKESQGL